MKISLALAVAVTVWCTLGAIAGHPLVPLPAAWGAAMVLPPVTMGAAPFWAVAGPRLRRLRLRWRRRGTHHRTRPPLPAPWATGSLPWDAQVVLAPGRVAWTPQVTVPPRLAGPRVGRWLNTPIGAAA